MAVESGWQRREPLLRLDPAAITQLIGASVLRAVLLSGGLRNTNYKVELADNSKAVLRLFTSQGGRGLETHEDPPCARELALLGLIADTVPVPRVFSANPTADPAWILMEFVDGERFDLVLQRMSVEEMTQASASAGAALARIHTFAFEQPGVFGPHLQISQPLVGSWLGFVIEGLGSGRPRQRVGAELADRVLRIIDQHAHLLEPHWSEARLLHCDYKPWNMLARHSSSGWQMAAVLDWEFACAGPPLYDMGIYLRYADRHPSAYTTAFLDGYNDAGGAVPDDAARLCRLIDLVSVCTFLERPEDDATITQDMRRVIVATEKAFSQ